MHSALSIINIVTLCTLLSRWRDNDWMLVIPWLWVTGWAQLQSWATTHIPASSRWTQLFPVFLPRTVEPSAKKSCRRFLNGLYWLLRFTCQKFLLSAAFLIKPAIGHLDKGSATRDFKNSAYIYKDHKHIEDVLGRYYRGENSLLV